MRPGRRGQALFLSFSTAVFLAVYLLPPGLWPWLGLLTLVPAGLCIWNRRSLASLVCLGAAAALLWCGAYRTVFFAPAQALDGRRTQVTFYLAESPTATDYGACAGGWVVQPGKAPVQAVLYADEKLMDVSLGDRVTVTANCSQTALRQETRFTARATRGVFLRLVAKGPMEVQQARGVPWWCLPRLWGEGLGRSVQQALPGDVSGFLKAMVTGDKSGIDSGLSTALRRAGISHLVAVSGMHVCFLVSFLTCLVGRDPRRRALVCVPALVFFTLAVGGAPSVMRACCLQLAVLLAELLGRETESWTSLFGTLAFLLLLDPFSAANVGLQLSFAAVAGIGLVTPRLRTAFEVCRLTGAKRWRWRVNVVLRFFTDLIATTLGALVFTVPLSAGYFGTLSLAAPLTNLLVLSVAGGLFAGTLVVGLVGMVFPVLAAGLGMCLAPLGRYVLWVAQGVSTFPYSCVSVGQVAYTVALAAGYGLVLIALFWRDQRRRVWLFSLCALSLVVGSIALTGWSVSGLALSAAVLDVGQGQNVVLASQGHTALIDCGGTGYTDPGDVCADYLNTHGESRVDALILTHLHADHANGLPALFHRLDIQEVILPAIEHDEAAQLAVLALASEEGTHVTWLAQDTVMTLGQMELRLYAPLGDGGANEEGLSVLVGTGDFHMLVTGDMNQMVEERLVRTVPLPLCQVLVAGHHGSGTSSGETLLNTVAPETAVISVGERNPYGHPAPETLDRLADRGVDIYRTDQLGTVTIQVKP